MSENSFHQFINQTEIPITFRTVIGKVSPAKMKLEVV